MNIEGARTRWTNTHVEGGAHTYTLNSVTQLKKVVHDFSFKLFFEFRFDFSIAKFMNTYENDL